jgi:uncharacterized protein (AIM24 family)
VEYDNGNPDEQLALETNLSTDLFAGRPPAIQFVGAGESQDDIGTFNGGSYRISHRDTNTVLTIQLAIGCPLTAKSGKLSLWLQTTNNANATLLGAMIAMSPTVTLKGSIKMSLKKVVAGAHITHSTYTGPGEVLLTPPMLGDITSISLFGEKEWSVGKDSFLACTTGVEKDLKRQGLGKAMFSGEGLFVYKIGGHGMLWISSFGAIIKKDVCEKVFLSEPLKV